MQLVSNMTRNRKGKDRVLTTTGFLLTDGCLQQKISLLILQIVFVFPYKSVWLLRWLPGR